MSLRIWIPRSDSAPALAGLPWLLLVLPALAHACPCSDPELCRPPRRRPDYEVFVFDIGQKTWKSYDWSQITTVAVFGKYDPELMCYAHSKGARVVLKGDVSLKEMVDPSLRASWIAQKIKLAKTQYMDGINIDIEQEVKSSSPEYNALTALVRETTDAFHREIEESQAQQTGLSSTLGQLVELAAQCHQCFVPPAISSQMSRVIGVTVSTVNPLLIWVTFDVAWSPRCIDRRCYNYTGIADACDFLFVMSYDEQSQVWSDCIAAANAPYNQTLAGYDDYIAMGIHPQKLVMGVPWYGYDYTCLSLSEADVCTIAKVPFRGAPCSDAAGRQVPYKTIMKQLNTSISGSRWDKEQQAPYYNYKDPAGRFHQVWYDDPRSITLKAAYVKRHGLKGIGMWNANCLDYSGVSEAKQQTEEMWRALKPAP